MKENGIKNDRTFILIFCLIEFISPFFLASLRDFPIYLDQAKLFMLKQSKSYTYILYILFLGG